MISAGTARGSTLYSLLKEHWNLMNLMMDAHCLHSNHASRLPLPQACEPTWRRENPCAISLRSESPSRAAASHLHHGLLRHPRPRLRVPKGLPQVQPPLPGP